MAATPESRPQLPAIWRRRRWPMLAALVLVLLAAVVAALVWPPTYVATGTILIEQQEVPADLVRSTITSFADQRIQMINQRVMTSDNLLGIVQKYDLYAKERKKRGRERILDMIRSDIQFGSIKASVIDPRQGRPVEATIAFSLSYQSSSPETAARVANELSSLYLQENLESRRQLADQATSFLTDEGDKLSRHIDELDANLAKFKQENLNTLPELASLNLQLASRADDEKRDVDTQLRSLDQQVVFLQSQLVQISKASPVYASTGERIMSSADRLKYLRSEYARASAVYAPDHPDVLRLKRQIEGMAADTEDSGADNERQRQLQDARTELAAARQRYSPDHPDVQRLERMVATLSNPASTAGSTAAAPTAEEPDNPAYIQLNTQLEAVRAERASLEVKRNDLIARSNLLQGRLATTPGVERDYMAMARELESTQAKYREVRQKQMEAQLAQNLEVERKGERFTLIDPPVPPDEPASPNRRLILVLGLVLALAFAVGIAALLEAVDPRIYGRNEIAGLLSVPPLAVIPWIENSAQQAARRRRQRFALAGTLASCVLAVFAIHMLYRPLDVLWAIAWRRLGG
jgi:polysaccharide biosynthesis transport protein